MLIRLLTEAARWLSCHVLDHHETHRVPVGLLHQDKCRHCPHVARTIIPTAC